MRNIAWIAVPVLFLGQPPARLAFAQDPPSIKVEVNVVNVVFNVRDKRGGLIGNLTKDDFTIVEDGKPQEIKYFTRETDIPMTIGLLIDVSAGRSCGEWRGRNPELPDRR